MRILYISAPLYFRITSLSIVRLFLCQKNGLDLLGQDLLKIYKTEKWFSHFRESYLFDLEMLCIDADEEYLLEELMDDLEMLLEAYKDFLLETQAEQKGDVLTIHLEEHNYLTVMVSLSDKRKRVS